MRISRVEVHSNGRHQVTLNISELRHKTPYVVKAISGLDVSEVASRFYGFSHLVGEDGRRDAYHEPVLPPRDIAIRVGFRPNYENYGARSRLRDDLYRLLGSTRANQVELRFFNEAEAVMHIFGSVQRAEAALFTEESEMVLTVQCKDPIFRGLAQSLYETPNQTIKSNVRSVKVFDKESTLQHGCSFKLIVASNCDEILIETVQSDNTSLMSFKVGSGFVVGGQVSSNLMANDVVLVNSHDKLPSLHVTRGSSAPAVILDKVVARSVWPTIHYGENVLTVQSKLNGNPTVPPLVRDLGWVPHYVGV